MTGMATFEIYMQSLSMDDTIRSVVSKYRPRAHLVTSTCKSM